MKSLILTEKPSVARDFATALNCSNSPSGYYEGAEYDVTFCLGHLLELFEPADYNPVYKEWSLDSLPIVPERFQHKPIKSTEKQLKIVCRLLSSGTYDRIILATDAGREGEVIGRLVLRHAGLLELSRVYRFWVSAALSPDVVKAGLAAVKPAKEFDAIFRAGVFRQFSDWLVGINLSRILSLQLQGKFSFGRVQSAVLFLIVRRYLENTGFTSKPYFVARGRFQSRGCDFAGYIYNGESKRFDTDKEVAELYGPALKDQKEATVLSVEEKEKRVPPPLLFNLTALQRAANSTLGFSAKKTLSLCQGLYETHHCLSYPRTPSRVLGESNVSMIRGLVENLKRDYADLFTGISEDLISLTNKRVFNDEKLEDHHALIPLKPLPGGASDDECEIYTLVLRSLAAAFSSNYVYLSVLANLKVNGVDFVAKGRRILEQGWKDTALSLEGEGSEEKKEERALIPALEEGEVIAYSGTHVEPKSTKAPPLFTEATLLAAMERPEGFTMLDDLDFHFEKGSGIGTQATRAATIETLLSREYISRQKKSLCPTDKGLHLFHSVAAVDSLARVVDVKETARWEALLSQNPRGFYDETVVLVNSLISCLKADAPKPFVKEKESWGRCPVCNKGTVFTGKHNYYCSQYKDGCKFVLWKTVFGKPLTAPTIKTLLSGKPTAKMKLKRKDGTGFSAALAIGEKGVIEFA